ncbi:MDR family MFS transporter [Propioniciclava tarda]|uniref:DHA2 family efflux MFS transporter permease subunit n=1 Tax=Propioniciclava tarda TaxID=433330 RepID=A0A4Q9KIY1_PROTD|nr:MDR family MFS transporter [Propioniciclava tarda]TBT94382.1 DHA2 family efflux MFS transporter permease subunit [Propioniciclava tarda]SMO72625.1 drug resistance transporter, EmrB/QacA subfamily [Propioniciclava tarda]
MTSNAAPRPAGELTHAQITTILIGLMTGMFLSALDQNVVGTAIKTIADDLSGLDQQAWVTTAYLITSTIATPIYGKLSDLYGRKPFYLGAITIFVVGSLLCTFSTSMYMLAAFRAVQGLGAGGLMSLALAIIGDIVPPRERAKYQGYFLAVFGTSSVLGPIVGGFFAEAPALLGITGWRWVFLVNVPVGIIAFLTVTATLKLHHVRKQASIDWAGAFFLIVGLVPALLVAEQGRTWGWTSRESLICYAIAVVGVLAFIAVEWRQGDNALIPLRIFRNRTILIGLTGGFAIGAGMFGGMITIPQYLQIVHSATPMGSGFLMLPMVLGMMIASVLSGQLMSRTGRVRIFPLIGIGLMVATLLAFSQVTADTPLWQFMTAMFFFGFGLGNTMQPLTLAVQASVHPREMGMATSSATFFRQIGGTAGVAVFISVLFNSLGDNIANAFKDASGTTEFKTAIANALKSGDAVNKGFAQALMKGDTSALSGVASDSSIIGKLDPVLAHPFKVGFSQSMDQVFLLGAAVCAVGFVILLFMPNIKLSNKSAAATLAEEAAKRSDAEGALVSAGHAGDAPTDEADASASELRPRRVVDDLVDAASWESGGHTMDELGPDQPAARRASQ